MKNMKNMAYVSQQISESRVIKNETGPDWYLETKFRFHPHL